MAAERMSGGEDIAEERIDIFKGVTVGEWTPFKQAVLALPQNKPSHSVPVPWHQIRSAYTTEIAAHQGQTRRNNEPYHFHPWRAAYIALYFATHIDPRSEEPLSTQEITLLTKIILLHDVIEDTTANVRGRKKREPYDDFEKRATTKMASKFSDEVALGVKSLTEPMVEGITIFTKQEAKEVRDQRLFASASLIKIAKGCDRLDNLWNYVPAPHKHPEEKLLETEQVILPMLDSAREDYPEFVDFLKQQISFAIKAVRKDIRDHPEKYKIKPVL